jgi:hypothetical protein
MNWAKFRVFVAAAALVLFFGVMIYLIVFGKLKPSLHNLSFLISLGIIVIGAGQFALAAYFARDVHRKFPKPYGYWEKLDKFLIHYWYFKAPKSKYGRYLTQKVIKFNIIRAALIVSFVMTLFYLTSSGIFRPR